MKITSLYMPEAKKKKIEREGEEREKDGKSHVSLVSGRKKNTY